MSTMKRRPHGKFLRRQRHPAFLNALAMVVGLSLLSNVAQAAVSCTVTATGPAFGIYDPLRGTPTLANSTVTATCTLSGGGNQTVALTSSYSTGSSGIYSTRTMLSGTNKLNYNLYFDAAFTQIRGNGTGGSLTGGGTLMLSGATPTQSISSTIYGRIPAGQDVAPGSYADTIVVTITY